VKAALAARGKGDEVVVYPEAYQKCGALIEDDAMVVVRGKLEKDDETARIVATEVFSIGTLRERVSREVTIRLAVPPHGRPTFEALADLLARFPGDRHLAVELDLTANGRSLRVRADVAQMRVRPSERLVSEVERLCGAGSVVLR